MSEEEDTKEEVPPILKLLHELFVNITHEGLFIKDKMTTYVGLFSSQDRLLRQRNF